MVTPQPIGGSPFDWGTLSLLPLSLQRNLPMLVHEARKPVDPSLPFGLSLTLRLRSASLSNAEGSAVSRVESALRAGSKEQVCTTLA